MEKYVHKIVDLRMQLSAMAQSAYKQNTHVCAEFYEKEKELEKVWKNAQAYCRRHNLIFSDYIR